MSAVLLVPLLPLLTTLIVVVGGEHVSRGRVRIAALPIALALCGAVATLCVVDRSPSGCTIPPQSFLFRYRSASTSIASAPS
jgi:hypothetical protein